MVILPQHPRSGCCPTPVPASSQRRPFFGRRKWREDVVEDRVEHRFQRRRVPLRGGVLVADHRPPPPPAALPSPPPPPRGGGGAAARPVSRCDTPWPCCRRSRRGQPPSSAGGRRP